ncbi:hypothetical protein GUITHDRAFT_115004 [Guillardia theta CCMP2712]|uniref:Alkylated DNA repair protein alkB homolog 8 n=1 Tax=Guillardia theta (strain CCMP2712) TaxID=905079 RepID=L1ISM5_GUITC|nr:hypothetical protein GUITHDRAFT_115004 [Guillardia theta CCMP2712]EKX38899.1 hypothetical protein GUITHDRAFT_115004 [Guillardia theta CCMP2712]|eukprot:XP_005825879.1 hypothetical protein GUITHDRAFT_115004 [Guillardia theta CCMP2712]
MRKETLSLYAFDFSHQPTQLAMSMRLSRKFRKATGLHIPYKRPNDPAAETRHLYCANLPEHDSSQDWRSHPLFPVCSEFGEVETMFLVPYKPVAYVTFVDEGSARKACSFLRESGLSGKLVHVQYAEACEKRPGEPNPAIPCTSLSKDLVVEGLILKEDFLSPEESEDTLNQLDELEWESSLSRRVQHFGFTFDYATRRVNTLKTRAFPPFLLRIAQRALREKLLLFEPDQCTVNEYQPGQGIRSHVDTHSAFEDGILSVSLGSSVVMEFRSPDGLSKNVQLKPGSALSMQGESRYKWAHGISNRKSDLVDGKFVQRCRRVSMTFRKIKTSPCKCEFPEQCDSQLAPIPKPRTVQYTDGTELDPLTLLHHADGDKEPEIERRHVHEVYDTIASHFSETRYKPWPKVAAFLQGLPFGSIVADVGCGNGRYLACAKHIAVIALDRCKGLVEHATEKAVLHHLSTPARRLNAIEELLRLVKVGGRVLIYAWAKEQGSESRFHFSNSDEMVPWSLPTTDGKDNVHVQRYCHLYVEDELPRLCEGISYASVERSYWDCSNWCVELIKVKERNE